MERGSDARTVRDLARQYAEVCAQPVQDERRDLWRRHNSLRRTRPLIYVRWLAAWHEAEESRLVCGDAFLRHHETVLRQGLFQSTIGDDTIQEPWLVQPASLILPEHSVWGVPFGRKPSPIAGGSWMYDPPLKSLADIDRLARPRHAIDEDATRDNADRLREVVGDIITVHVDRAPGYRDWNGDISTNLAYLRGLEQVMWDMVDDPAGLHELVAFMRDGILATHEAAEQAGDWSLAEHENQAMPYSLELQDPTANPHGVKRRDLWGFFAAQEMAQVSPAMHEEFVFEYQLPIAREFGLVAYGCCENLTHKIDMLRRLPNLRRIAVTPTADVALCAEQIGEDYVFSWRPNPSQMICCGFDRDLIRRVVREAMDASRGCHVDITLKDVQTVQGNTANLREWVRIVRDITDGCC